MLMAHEAAKKASQVLSSMVFSKKVVSIYRAACSATIWPSRRMLASSAGDQGSP